MFKRINAFLCSILLFAASVMTAVPVASAVGPNLIANPSMETGTATVPTAWSNNKWGTNASTFTYKNTGRTGTKSVATKTTAYTSGDAKWSFEPVTVTPGVTYTYSDWYQSTTVTEMTLAVTNPSGGITYTLLGQVPASTDWKQASYTFKAPASTAKLKVLHYVKSVGELTLDDASLTADDTTQPTAPTVNMTAPTAGATVSGTTALSANATDAQAVANVQFKINGANVGTADTTAPYSTDWATTSVANGSYAVTAVATNTSNLSTTSAPVNVTVSNTTTPPPVEGTNLIPNPSMEQGTAIAPTGWFNNKWGTNTSAFTYKNTGRTGTKSLTTKTTAYTSGDAKWTFTPINVSPNTTYTYSDWYQSTTPTGVTLAYTSTTNVISYVWLGDIAASTAWKQSSFTFKTPANAAKLQVLHYVHSVGELTLDDASLTSATNTPPTAPTVSVTAPASNATVNGTVALTASASDAQAVSSVQFKINGTNVGAADTTAPYVVNWDSKTVANGAHTITAVATNTASLSTTSNPVSITVDNTVVTPPTAPTVSITAPASGSTVNNTVSVTADASDAQTVTSVQFKLDGTNLGAADATAPYSVSWDTKTAQNGSRAITAVATNNSNLTTTSSTVNVTVTNTVTPPPAGNNLIANPSVEDGGTAPTDWTSNSWGTNTSSLTYDNAGRTGGKSLKVNTTAYTNGDAKWSFAPVAATPNDTYNYSNWYKSNVETEVDAMVTLSNGTVQFYYLTTVPASADWREAKVQFTAPAGATNLTIFQVMAKVGTLQTDDYSLVAHTPAKFNRPLVSLTFDDSWRSIYDPGFDLLNKYGLKSTQYLNSDPTDGGYPDYMTYDMVKDFAANGHELGWHTRSHANLTTLTASAIATELTIPTAFLANINQPASNFKNFATPYGAYNTTAVNEIKKKYRSHRSTDVGYNSKDSFDIYNIRVQNVKDTTTPADVQGWVNQAIATNTWLVLVYHEVEEGPADPTYAVTPANLDAELNIIKQSGVAVVTVNQALDEIVPQL